MASFDEITAVAFKRFTDIVGQEKEFPDLAGHIFLQRLLQESPLVYRSVVLKHNLVGKVYTPVIAEAIRYMHLWGKQYLAPENQALLLKYDDVLGKHPLSKVEDKEVRKEAIARVKEHIIDYVHKRHNFFAQFSNKHEPIEREEVKDIFSRILIVISDHERILGIGDQGSSGSHISAGKLNCYFLSNGMFPGYALPIGVDVGTNNKAKLADKHYDGVQHPRLGDEHYYPFMDIVNDAVAELKPGVFQFEDYKGERAWNILALFMREHHNIFSFNDDSQGTGSVVIAGLLAAERVLPDIAKRLRTVFLGAGGAGTGIAQEVHEFLTEHGIKNPEERMVFADSAGVLYENRTVKSKKGRKEFYSFQKPYIVKGKRQEQLEKAAAATIKGWKRGDEIPMELAAVQFACNFLVGTSTKPGKFTPELLKNLQNALRERGEDDTILEFSMSNPTTKTECLTEEESEEYADASPERRKQILRTAIKRHLDATNGKLYLATGSPFPAVTWKGKQYDIGQANNVFIFPGIGLALDYINAHNMMTEQQKRKLDMLDVLYSGAEGLAKVVDRKALENRRLYPPADKLEQAITAVACSILKKITTAKPTPQDISAFRWADQQQPQKQQYDSTIIDNAADFSLDKIRKELNAYKKLEAENRK